ncbi:hypothetical protein SEA_FEDE_41 [Microbacterium phage Fede]|nr:hypothetical protein SEA_FEDE_41 [Microbacterium phage Fede]
MASFWDDLVRNLTGQRSAQPSKSSTKTLSKQAPRAEQQAQPQRAQTKFASVLADPQPQLTRGGGGGGRGGMAAMSITPAKPDEQKPEPVKQDPLEMFMYGQNEQGRRETEKARNSEFNFWDDLGAYFTTPVDGNIFTSPGIAGAAQRKKDDEDAHAAAGLKPGDIPSNEQLKQLGEDDDLVNIDGDLVPLGNSPFGNVQLLQQAAQADQQNARDDWASSLGGGGEIKVRELTNEEWAQLSPEQQRGVTASWALYQASLADQALDGGAEVEEGYDDTVASIFGADGGSDTYAPNTVRVLQELGFTNESADLDQFIDQSALPSFEDITGTSFDKGRETRQGIYSSLAGSQLFNSESITSSLDAGRSLLDALSVSGTVSDQFKTLSGVTPDYSGLTDDDFNSLNTLLNNLSNREVFARIATDPELNQRLTDSIAEANSIYGPELVAKYFTDSVGTFDNTTDYMTPDEFRQYWMEG